MSSTPSALNDELVRAGAGAGKTTALVARVMELIAHYRGQNQKWPRLVVTTFTRKATQELRERLTVEACRRQDLELLDYCRSRSRLHISTIHGVMGLFLRRYGHLLGIDPSYTILTETGAAQMRRQILRQVLMSETAGSDLLEQYRLAALENMLREFADAKAAHPDLRPLTESEILQMQGAAAAKLGHDAKSLAEEIRGATQHETWLKYAQILSQLAKLLQHPWNKENWDLIMSFWDGFPSKPRKGPNTISDDLDENIKTWRENLKKWLDDPGHSPFAGEQLAAQAVKFRHLGEAYATRIREHKMTQGQMEMSDLELLALKTLRDQPSVGQAFSCDWDHWLIDEYQDTSPVQTELLKLLVGGRPRYIVGDPQQSIYLFRGARSEVFAHEEAALRAKGGHTQVKMKNYRSHPSLLCFINDFFAKVSPDFQAMEPRSLEFHPRKAVATFHQATVEDGQGPRQSEYQAMASHIQHLLKNEKAQLSDICVLTRKNRTLLDIAQFLKEQGYPTHVHASRGYSARREVQDALALLKFLAHPADDQNLMALLRSPWCRVRDDQLVKNIKRDRMSYWQQLQNSELKNHPALARLKQSQGEAIELGLSMAWEKALLRFCFFDLSTHHDATGRREANLWKLVANLALAERRP
ncbi:MAG: UvrD-helicase domain-containing protein, partial [Bdellovibrionales bacterium]